MLRGCQDVAGSLYPVAAEIYRISAAGVGSDERLPHEPEPDPAHLAAVLHPDQSALGDDVADGSDPLASTGGTSAALASLG
jgi:hypothetical protein